MEKNSPRPLTQEINVTGRALSTLYAPIFYFYLYTRVMTPCDVILGHDKRPARESGSRRSPRTQNTHHVLYNSTCALSICLILYLDRSGRSARASWGVMYVAARREERSAVQRRRVVSAFQNCSFHFGKLDTYLREYTVTDMYNILVFDK